MLAYMGENIVRASKPAALVTLLAQKICTRLLAVWKKSVSDFVFFFTLKQMHLPFFERLF